MADSVSNRYVTNKDSSPSRSLQQGCDRIIHDTQGCRELSKGVCGAITKESGLKVLAQILGELFKAGFGYASRCLAGRADPTLAGCKILEVEGQGLMAFRAFVATLQGHDQLLSFGFYS